MDRGDDQAGLRYMARLGMALDTSYPLHHPTKPGVQEDVDASSLHAEQSPVNCIQQELSLICADAMPEVDDACNVLYAMFPVRTLWQPSSTELSATSNSASIQAHDMVRQSESIILLSESGHCRHVHSLCI